MGELDGACVVGVEDGHGFDWAASTGASVTDAFPALARLSDKIVPTCSH